MPETPVSFSFGDGTNAVGTLGEKLHHPYRRPGKYTVTAVDALGRVGRTEVEVSDDSGGTPNPDPAKPTLTVTDRTVQVGGPAVEYTSRLRNTQGTSEECVIHSTLSAPGITPESIVTEYDTGGGTWEAVSTLQDGADRIRFDFGTDGFTIDPSYDKTTNLRQTVPAGSPLQPGTAQGRQWVDSTKDGKTLTEATYTVTVDAADGAPAAPVVESVTPASGAAGTEATITGENLGGTA